VSSTVCLTTGEDTDSAFPPSWFACGFQAGPGWILWGKGESEFTSTFEQTILLLQFAPHYHYLKECGVRVSQLGFFGEVTVQERQQRDMTWRIDNGKKNRESSWLIQEESGDTKDKGLKGSPAAILCFMSDGLFRRTWSGDSPFIPHHKLKRRIKKVVCQSCNSCF